MNLDDLLCSETHNSWCAKIRLELANSTENRFLILREIRNKIPTLSRIEINHLGVTINLTHIFKCIQKKALSELAANILIVILSNMDPCYIATHYIDEFEASLKHEYEFVKIMALTELHRIALTKHLNLILQNNNILLAITDTLMATCSNEVPARASHILIVIGRHPDGLKLIQGSLIGDALNRIMNANNVFCYRVLHIFAAVASQSDELLEKFFPSLMLEFQLMDFKNAVFESHRLSIIRHVSMIANCTRGVDRLRSVGFITTFMENLLILYRSFQKTRKLEKEDTEMYMSLLIFYANVTRWRANEMFDDYPEAFDMILNIVQSNDFSFMDTAYDVIGLIASSIEGKRQLENIGDKFLVIWANFEERVRFLPMGIRNRALYCIERLLRLEKNDQNDRNWIMIEKWFFLLSRNPVVFIKRCAENAFIQTRKAGLCILHAISEQAWAHDVINSTAGFVQSLVIRYPADPKDCKIVKYEIIKALAAGQIFTGETLLELQQYVKEGPFYIPPQFADTPEDNINKPSTSASH